MIPEKKAMYIEYLVPAFVAPVTSNIVVFLISLLETQATNRIAEPPFIVSYLIAFTFCGVGLIALFLLYRSAMRGISFTTKLLTATAVTPILGVASVILGQAIIMSIFKGIASGALAILLLASLYLTIILEILLIADYFSRRAKNIIVIFYGSILGTFFGLWMPIIVVVIVCSFLAFFDALVVTVLFKEDIHAAAADRSYLSYFGKYIEIGPGEFVFYSAPVALASYRLGAPFGILALALIIVGCLVNLRILEDRGVMAGLTIPTFLALIPSIFLTIPLYYF